jgi:hypothetical protein
MIVMLKKWVLAKFSGRSYQQVPDSDKNEESKSGDGLKRCKVLTSTFAMEMLKMFFFLLIYIVLGSMFYYQR